MTVIHPPSRKEGLKKIGHSMNMVLDTKKTIFTRQEWLWFHIWFIMTFYYKMRQILLQNTKDVLL